MTSHNCRWCNEKYAHPRSAERCCTYKAVQISKEDIPNYKNGELIIKEIKIKINKEKKPVKKKSFEEQSAYNKMQYQKHKEKIRAKQKEYRILYINKK